MPRFFGPKDTVNEANIADYTKEELDELLDQKANKTDVYSAKQIDDILKDKANVTSVYTKTESDTLLAEKADVSEVYTKVEDDAILATKANVSDVYTQAEIDALLEGLSSGSNSNLLPLTVAPGETITAGDVVRMINGGIKKATNVSLETTSPVVFENATTSFMSACVLDSKRVLVAYCSIGNSNSGTAVVVTISGSTISVGTPVVFETTAVKYALSACALDSERVLVAYAFEATNTPWAARVLTISGSTISVGTPVTWGKALTTHSISACALDSERVLVAYIDGGNSGYGTAIRLTISGATISKGTSVVFESANIFYLSACVLDSDRVLVAYCDSGNSNYGTAVVVTISGSTISAGTPVVFRSGQSSYISACALDSGRVLVAYSYAQSSSYGTVVGLTISGSTISVGTPVTFENTATTFISACALDSERALVAYQNDSYQGAVTVVTISGSTISKITPIELGSISMQWTSICALDSGRVLMAYRGGSSYGTACVVDVNNALNSVSIAIGIARDTKSAGETCTVAVGPIISELTGLIQGAVYFLGDNGTLTTNSSRQMIGIALSDSQLLWQPAKVS